MNDGEKTGRDTDNPAPGLTFPCIIDIKIFLNAQDNNMELVRDVLLMSISHDDLVDVSRKESRNGKYHSYSCRVNARDRQQMDELYIRLTSHPEVIMVI